MRISLHEIILSVIDHRHRQGGQWSKRICTSSNEVLAMERLCSGEGGGGFRRARYTGKGFDYELYYDWIELSVQDIFKVLEPIHLYQDFFDVELEEEIESCIHDSMSIRQIADHITEFILERPVVDHFEEGYFDLAPPDPSDTWEWWYSFPYYYASVA